MAAALGIAGRAAPVAAAALLGAGGLAAGAPAAVASAPVPPRLSADHRPADLRSTHGSGAFGRWTVDGFGLPAFRYLVDEQRTPWARQPETGSTAAQHELGNDHIVAAAWNHGYTELWSQDRLAQWANRWEPAARHYAGGYGYLRVGGRTLSTLYLDRPRGARSDRVFGVGYYGRRMRSAGMEVEEAVYAPFGDDPLLLHDVTIRNVSRTARRVSWFEYWDVNPYDQTHAFHRGLASPRWNGGARTLSVAQTPDHGDNRPLSIFAAQLRGPDGGHASSQAALFGAGTRAAPAAVAADRLDPTPAPPVPSGASGATLFAFRAPLRLAPGQAVTLRYAYGIAHPGRIAPLVRAYRRARDPGGRSERAWAAWLPKADFGPGRRWVARELAWDAYLLRAASVYEEECGHHTITQGGYYQYSAGLNLGFRSWLHYLPPMTYADPAMAREILRYSMALQPARLGPLPYFPYGIGPLCTDANLGTSGDLDVWLLMAAAQYGLGSRDNRFFDERLAFRHSTRSASLWEHVKLTYRDMESLRGPHGGYQVGSTGDWSDFSVTYLGMDESLLITAQLAYAYPQLAQLADLRRDHGFAAELRARAAELRAVMRRNRTARGWYARGFGAKGQIGHGLIFGEPQPWAILAGVPTDAQAGTLVAAIRRFLTGIGAPRGPSPIGSAMAPALNDPGITERGATTAGPAGSNGTLAGAAAYPGGVWYDINGWLTWALARLDGRVRHAATYAWSEYTRNTLAAHATAYPRHWGGTISADDACNAFYSPHPSRCGVGLFRDYDGQVTEQPAWMVMNSINLAGVTPTERGYDVAPHLARFSLRLPRLGVAAGPGCVRGYMRPQRAGRLVLRVRAPAGARTGGVTTWARGRLVPHRAEGNMVVLALPSVPRGHAVDWAVARGRGCG
ncbi:MAG: hypothetical protein U0T02_05200 [Solirubrobacteraceae bacterium]